MSHRYCTRCSTLMQTNTTCPKCSHPHGKALTAEHHTARWVRLSKHALATHPWCTRCTRRPPAVTLTVHHLRYPARTPADVEVLCRGCHANETATPTPR